jgi:hypothetical protein
VRPAYLPVLTLGSSSVPPGTTSTIRSPPGTHRIQHEYIASNGKIMGEGRTGNYEYFECCGRGCSEIHASEIHASKLRTFKYRTADVKAEFLIWRLPETPEVVRI